MALAETRPRTYISTITSLVLLLPFYYCTWQHIRYTVLHQSRHNNHNVFLIAINIDSISNITPLRNRRQCTNSLLYSPHTISLTSQNPRSSSHPLEDGVLPLFHLQLPTACSSQYPKTADGGIRAYGPDTSSQHYRTHARDREQEDVRAIYRECVGGKAGLVGLERRSVGLGFWSAWIGMPKRWKSTMRAGELRQERRGRSWRRRRWRRGVRVRRKIVDTQG
jgi:hypothetical protein